MQSDKPELFGNPSIYRLVFITALVLFSLMQMAVHPGALSGIRPLGNDDAMRLLSVRDLIAGQGWFDTYQHRALPPEGVSLHWSRLIDAPMAVLLSLFSTVFSTKAAESLLLALWPSFFFVLYLFVTGRAARAAFGNPAASMAVLAGAMYPAFGANIFTLGRIDHHNVQFLCMVSVFALLMTRKAPLRAGLAAGAIAAFSLAVGLEAIMFMALSGVILVLRYLQGIEGEESRLLGFGAGLGLVAPLLFAVQIAPVNWAETYCDQLSLPFLRVTSWALVFCFTAWALRVRVTALSMRLLVVLVALSVFFVLVLPGLRHCAQGPFSDVPDAVRIGIIGNITESFSAMKLITELPDAALTFLLPTTLITVLSAIILLFGGQERRPWAELLAFLLLGVLASIWQLRAIYWANAVLPIAFGAVFGLLANRIWLRPALLRLLVTLVLIVVFFFPQSCKLFWSDEKKVATFSLSDRACIAAEALTPLQKIEPALIMAPLNIGAFILLDTNHSVTGVPYHRSADAMLNGVLPFDEDAKQMMERVQQSRAEMVLVCDGQRYRNESSMGSALARGIYPVWLEPVELSEGPVRLFKVLRTSAGDLKQ